MLNMDMIGRMRNNQLSRQRRRRRRRSGSDARRAGVRRRARECTIGGSGYGPSDHMAFYVAGVPVLFFFTGNHLDYHTATDDAEKINAAGGSRVAMIVADVALAVANASSALTFVKAPPETMAATCRARRRVARHRAVVQRGSERSRRASCSPTSFPTGRQRRPASRAAIASSQIGSIEIRNINDLMFVLQAAKPGTDVKITFVRDGKRVTVERHVRRAARPQVAARDHASFTRPSCRAHPTRTHNRVMQKLMTVLLVAGVAACGDDGSNLQPDAATPMPDASDDAAAVHRRRRCAPISRGTAPTGPTSTAWIASRGCLSPGYDKTKKPIALFDWDNTISKNDFGDAITFYLIANGKVLQPPGQDWKQTSAFLTDAAVPRSPRRAAPRSPRGSRCRPTRTRAAPTRSSRSTSTRRRARGARRVRRRQLRGARADVRVDRAADGGLHARRDPAVRAAGDRADARRGRERDTDDRHARPRTAGCGSTTSRRT